MAADGDRRVKRTPLPVRRAQATIAEHLSTWRRLRGITQQQAAERAGVGRATIARLEAGDGGVSFETVLRVLRALGLLDVVVKAFDPLETEVGRLRASEQLPVRVRHRTPT